MLFPRPKISVAMPVFNGGDYFAVAVESVLAQAYEPLEIVIVNDGSKDDGHTASLGQAFAARYPERVVYIEQPNGGVASALNTAIASMTGDIFCWLSHDDLFEPNKLERQVEFWRALNRENAILFSDYQLINSAGEPTYAVRFDREMFRKAPQLPLFRGAINGCTIFAPLDLIRAAGGFEEQYRYTQDYWLWLKLWENSEFFHQPEILVRYRQHEGQDSHKPAAVTEGEVLWRAMVDRPNAVDRANMYGSTWRFWDETHKILDPSPYKEVAAYCADRRSACLSETKVSVIIPFFNEVELTTRAIRSVQAQTHNDLEIIVVDDGSTDDVSAIEAICQTEPRAKYVRQNNTGPAGARNRGLSLASGEYVAFLDADDQFLPHKLERQLLLMSQSGAVASHTSYVARDAASGEERLYRSGAENGILYPDLMSNCMIAAPTVMLHRSILARGFRFPEHLQICEDVLAWCWLAQRSPILGIDEPLTIVERDASSAALNTDKARQGLTGLLQALEADPAHSREEEALAKLRGALDTVGGPLASATAEKPDFEDLMQEAERRHLAGDHAGAARLVEEAIHLKASSFALYFSGMLHFVLGDLDQAILRLEQAAAGEQSPSLNAASWFQLGLALARKGRLAEAAHYFGRHVASGSVTDLSRYYYASVLANLRRFEEAEPLFERNLPVPLGDGNEGSTAIIRLTSQPSPADWLVGADRTYSDLFNQTREGYAFTVFASVDEGYLQRYGPALLRSVRANGGGAVHLHLHVVNPGGVDPAKDLGVKPEDSISISSESLDLSALSDHGRRTYYACSRYRAAERFGVERPGLLVVADADQMLVSNPTGCIELEEGEAAAFLHFPDASYNLMSMVSASVSVFRTSDEGRAILGQIADYVEAVLTPALQNPWHLDQVALAAILIKAPRGLIGGLAPSTMSGSTDGSVWRETGAVFATITSSVPGSEGRSTEGDMAQFFRDA